MAVSDAGRTVTGETPDDRRPDAPATTGVTRTVPMVDPIAWSSADGAGCPSGGASRPIRRDHGAVAGLLGVLAALVVAGSVTTVVDQHFGQARHRPSAIVSADRIDIDVADGAASVTALSIDAGSLIGGARVDRCLVTNARVDDSAVVVRLSGRLDGGSGLERFIATRIQTGTGTAADCGDFTAGSTVFSGTLDRLGQDHGTFEEGVTVLEGTRDADMVTIRVELSVLPDDRATGRTTDFWLDVEGRR